MPCTGFTLSTLARSRVNPAFSAELEQQLAGPHELLSISATVSGTRVFKLNIESDPGACSAQEQGNRPQGAPPDGSANPRISLNPKGSKR
jgi:hypothetical protein